MFRFLSKPEEKRKQTFSNISEKISKSKSLQNLHQLNIHLIRLSSNSLFRNNMNSQRRIMSLKSRINSKKQQIKFRTIDRAKHNQKIAVVSQIEALNREHRRKTKALSQPPTPKYNMNENQFRIYLTEQGYSSRKQKQFIEKYNIIQDMKKFKSFQNYLNSRNVKYYLNLDNSLLLSDNDARIFEIWKKSGKEHPKVKIMSKTQINSVKNIRSSVISHILQLNESDFLKWLKNQSFTNHKIYKTMYYDYHIPTVVTSMQNNQYRSWYGKKERILSRNTLNAITIKRESYLNSIALQKENMQKVNTFENYISTFSPQNYYFNERTQKHYISNRLNNHLNSWKQLKGTSVSHIKVVPFQKLSDMKKRS